MSSILRINASRDNGAKSNGPATSEGKLAAAANSANSTGPIMPEGKAIVSQNATRHGLLADSLVLDGEAEVRFVDMLSALRDQIQPITQFARTFRALADGSNVLELLSRCETRFSCEYLRAFVCFNQNRDRKNSEISKQSEPNIG